MNKVSKLLLALASIVITISIGYIIGVRAGNYFSEEKQTEIRAKGVKQTREVLETMGSLKVGTTLTDYSFDGVDGKNYKLSELVSNRSLICYIQTDCPSCLTELNGIVEAVKNDTDFKYFIIISDASVEDLRELRDNFRLKCPLLHDSNRGFGEAYKIFSFPFSLVVNSELQVEEIYTTPLLPDDYDIIIDVNRY